MIFSRPLIFDSRTDGSNSNYQSVNKKRVIIRHLNDFEIINLPISQKSYVYEIKSSPVHFHCNFLNSWHLNIQSVRCKNFGPLKQYYSYTPKMSLDGPQKIPQEYLVSIDFPHIDFYCTPTTISQLHPHLLEKFDHFLNAKAFKTYNTFVSQYRSYIELLFLTFHSVTVVLSEHYRHTSQYNAQTVPYAEATSFAKVQEKTALKLILSTINQLYLKSCLILSNKSKN